jgi:AhpD family alkylhydroperoxidase
MVQFTIHDESSAPDEARPALALAKKQLGFVPNLYGVLAESPQALAAYQAVADQFQKSSLPNTARHVVWLTASRQNGCTYCVAAHSAMAAAAGLDKSTIEAIREDKPIDSVQLEAVRRFTVQVVDGRGWVADDDV